MDVLGLDHVDLTVNDLARSIPFYEEVLGALGFRRVPHVVRGRAETTQAVGIGAGMCRGGVKERDGMGPGVRRLERCAGGGRWGAAACPAGGRGGEPEVRGGAARERGRSRGAY